MTLNEIEERFKELGVMTDSELIEFKEQVIEFMKNSDYETVRYIRVMLPYEALCMMID